MRRVFGESWQLALPITSLIATLYTVAWTGWQVFHGDWGAAIGYLFFGPLQGLLVAVLLILPVWVACFFFVGLYYVGEAAFHSRAFQAPWRNRWVRWVAVIPGALLATLLADFPLHWLVLILHAMGSVDSALSIGSVDPREMERFGIAVVNPLAFIYACARIAPGRRKAVAIASACAVALVMVGSTSYFAGSGRLLGSFPWNVFPLVLNAIGIAGGLYAVMLHLESEQARLVASERFVELE
jgi:hypothetical protein